MVKAEGQTSGNYKNTSARGTLQVIFKGYKAEAAYKKALTIKVNKKLPAIQASAANTVLYPEYPETGLDTTTVSFRLKANGQELFKGRSLQLPRLVAVRVICPGQLLRE